MVKLTSILALSSLIIAPALASELWDLESRDVIEPEAATFFARGLFARQPDFEHPNLVRRIVIDPSILSAGKAAAQMGYKAFFGRDLQETSVLAPHYTAQDLLPHKPFTKHELARRDFDDQLFERELDHNIYIREFTDEDLFERFYDDLD